MSEKSELLRRLRVEVHALEEKLGVDNALAAFLRQQLTDTEEGTVDERRGQVFRRAAWDLTEHDVMAELVRVQPAASKDVTEAVVALGGRLDQKYAEFRAVREFSESINEGYLLADVMRNAFAILDTVLPYDRMGVSLIDEDRIGHKWVRLEWVQANYETIHLKVGHSAKLDQSTLHDSVFGQDPLFLNDLAKHYEENPDSTTSAMLLKEGIHSNLSYPLIVHGEVIGFIFFSSLERDTYRNVHIDLFAQVAKELALVIDKSRTYEKLNSRTEFIKTMFGRYVTEEVADIVYNSNTTTTMAGQRKKVTILFADLRDFTSMSETFPPEVVVDTLNTYLVAMTECVAHYEGHVDNFIGDAILAVFGAPVSKFDDSGRAIACAIAMENKMLSVNAELKSRGLPELGMGIGLNTGEVVAGNIGSDLRMTYSVIGSPVNIASRVSAFATKGQILATEDTFSEHPKIIEVEGNLKIKVKGIADPIQVYDLTAINGLHNIRKWSHQDSLLTPTEDDETE
ncbi:MAG: GAF domain-containing protein [Rhodospirillaceae bacterium]|nr:GAF domain-containing protein [Rhodospirillaceae bacterium]MBT5565363.1 GAF domain-containing protein [Rhodospirillaceae bacterium]MBT6089102.1 GAF domain-containing protein [Rhodospirillaceae bacterium]MBT6960176.1 GAF domain-containing protein [Rhodospirillaceae bacterium]MBT7449623.1 GAF domain-containing protein [Rhodospirillaceae bacterium]